MRLYIIEDFYRFSAHKPQSFRQSFAHVFRLAIMMTENRRPYIYELMNVIESPINQTFHHVVQILGIRIPNHKFARWHSNTQSPIHAHQRPTAAHTYTHKHTFPTGFRMAHRE